MDSKEKTKLANNAKQQPPIPKNNRYQTKKMCHPKTAKNAKTKQFLNHD